MSNLIKKYNSLNLFESDFVEIFENQRESSGIYFLYYKNDVIYIGKSERLFDRPFQHKNDKKFDCVKVFYAPKEWLDYLESAFVGDLRPMLNGKKKEGLKKFSDFHIKDLIAFESPTIALEIFSKYKNKNFVLSPEHKYEVRHAHDDIRQFEKNYDRERDEHKEKYRNVSIAQKKRWEKFRLEKAIQLLGVAPCP